MTRALAPGMRRGWSWGWLSLALASVIAIGPAVLAQDPPKKGETGTPTKTAEPPKNTATPTKGAPPATKDASKGDAPKADATKDAAKKGDAAKKDDDGADDAPAANEGPEIFKDPRAEKALTIFKTVPGWRATTPQNISDVKNMAAGGASPDRDAITKFVQGMGYELTQKNNINGLIDPPPDTRPGARTLRAIQEATDNLIDPINTARLAKNTGFLSTYTTVLLENLPKLLDNNLIPRTQAVIVLGQTGSPLALPIFLAQLKDPNQTVQVKLWSVRGIANSVENGARGGAIPAAEAIAAGKAISDFLEREKDTLWFLQMRALEALGSMRQAAVPNNMQKAEMANTAMKFLANPEARPEVRAAAAWSLGMMQVNPALVRYNFPLIAYDTGLLAAELGDKINASFKENPTRASYLTGLLVQPIYQAFNGMEGARESGLLHSPALGPSKEIVSRLADLSSSVARAAVALLRAPTGQQADRKKDLGEQISTLKAYLAKNAPKDFRLVPGGPEFKIEQAQVAGAPADQKNIAGATGGR